jgi:hypothetical protein
MVGVDVIDADDGMADPRFARTGVADGDLFPAEHFGTAGGVNANGMGHVGTPN